MSDPYTPALAEFAFTADERSAIVIALASPKPWDWEPGGELSATLKSVKKKIHDLHMARHGNRCCYCRKNLKGGGHFVIDREHVLPKSIAAYRPLTYEVWNLGISCKRCNMQYKKDKIDFVVDPNDAVALLEGGNYRLIHPNFDLYRDHISISVMQDDDITVVKYTKKPGSGKGEYTYDYFNLRELEVGSFDEAQGIARVGDLKEGGLEARALADGYRS